MTKKTILITGFFLYSINTFAFFSVVSAPGVESRQDVKSGYQLIIDNEQRIKELQKLANMADELAKLQTQIINLVNLNKTAMNTYNKMVHMVTEHGDWKDIATGDMFNKIHRYSDQKLHTTTSILSDINKSPEKVIDNSSILRNYFNKIDIINWTQDDKTGKEKLSLKMTAAQKLDIYENFRNKLHGYTDEITGENHEGELQKLSDQLEEAKKDLGKAKTDVAVATQTERVKQIQEQIDYNLRKSEMLRRDYEITVAASKQEQDVADLVSDNKSELIHEKDKEDKEIRVPQTKSVYDYFKKQEDGVV
jgi:hypothetical protein